MKKLCVLLLLTAAGTVQAQQDIVDQFQVRSLEYAGLTLPYRLFVPADYDPGEAYPLVLALHGAGERGTDNERQIRLHRLATSWADPDRQALYPAFVVAPQVPPDRRWSAEQPVGASDFTTVERATLAILDSMAAEFTIDPERIYITGLSMGGHGTWDLVSRLPDRFAAAVPMSGWAYADQAPKLLHLPVWAFHGERDTVVRPDGARAIIQSMDDLGRDVVYTDCRRSPVGATRYDCPPAMSNAELAERIDAHADLIFTSLRDAGHGPWTVWYDHPLLAGWLFSKQRVVPGAVSVGSPVGGDVWSGMADVSWSPDGVDTDTVEVWLSTDEGVSWSRLGTAARLDGVLTVDSSTLPDAGAARIRLILRNAAGRVFGRDTGPRFRIDNSGDGAPYLRVDDEVVRFAASVVSDAVVFDLTASDPEGAALTLDTYYSTDGGGAWMHVASQDLPPDTDPRAVEVDVQSLPNSGQARLRFEVSDGSQTVAVVTAPFEKATPRHVNHYVEHVNGEGEGTITLHFVDLGRLTGHRYRLTVDATDPFHKTYDVTDLDASTTVLTDVPLSDGVLESPEFDGIRLVVQDLATGRPDLDRTGWTTGSSTLEVTIRGGSLLIAVLRVYLLETGDTYDFAMTAEPADTSVAMFGMPALPYRFTVTARSDGSRRRILLRDVDRDGYPGNGDQIFILEPDRDGELYPAWELRFSATAETVLPVPGDVFTFVPVPKLGSDDVFEFIAAEGVRRERPVVPADDPTIAVYPNPFSDRATVVFESGTSGRASVDVYDLLGRRMAGLFEGPIPQGEHRIGWDAATLGRIPAGLYMVRLSLESDGGRGRTTVHRAVVRIR